jgi:hypothetical protein
MKCDLPISVDRTFYFTFLVEFCPRMGKDLFTEKKQRWGDGEIFSAGWSLGGDREKFSRREKISVTGKNSRRDFSRRG